MILWRYGQERIRREAEEAAIDAEIAVMHGYANVTVKGHLERRQKAWRRNAAKPAKSGANVAGWQQLARKFGELGWGVQQGGESLVQ